jgi:hypothetical protein
MATRKENQTEKKAAPQQGEQRSSEEERDLKEREYRDSKGELHHHTHKYMEQHQGEGEKGGKGEEE